MMTLGRKSLTSNTVKIATACFAFVAGGSMTVAAATPIPLQFAPGSYGVLVNGEVTHSVQITTYSFDANAGQTLIITFTGNGPMRGDVQCQGGGDGPYQGTGSTFVVPKTGRCLIDVGANLMAEPWTGGFTLAVLAATPSAPP